MSKRREENYDLLRISSAFAIVLLHVSGGFLKYNEIKAPINNNLILMLLNCATRFAVPCFFMLSGAFVLADDRNADYKRFYRKSLKNFGITGATFCILYLLYNIVKLIIGVFLFHKHDIRYLAPKMFDIFKSLLKGAPYFHLWYLFLLVGLYISTPFIIRLAVQLRDGGEDLYGKFTIAFLALASVSYITSEHILNWDIGLQFCYLSYFLMGCKLRRWGNNRKSNMLAFMLIISGFVVNVGLGFINYLRGLKGLPVDVISVSQNPFSYAPLAPIEVIASCLIFAGFSVMKVKKDYYKLSSCTFLIYLIHAGVRDVIQEIIGERLFGNPVIETVSVVIISIVVFVVSLLIGVVYKKIINFKILKARN